MKFWQEITELEENAKNTPKLKEKKSRYKRIGFLISQKYQNDSNIDIHKLKKVIKYLNLSIQHHDMPSKYNNIRSKIIANNLSNFPNKLLHEYTKKVYVAGGSATFANKDLARKVDISLGSDETLNLVLRINSNYPYLKAHEYKFLVQSSDQKMIDLESEEYYFGDYVNTIRDILDSYLNVTLTSGNYVICSYLLSYPKTSNRHLILALARNKKEIMEISNTNSFELILRE